MFTQILEGHPRRQKCLYYTIISLGTLLAFFVLVAAIATGKSAGFWGQSYPDRTIQVSGYGEVQAVPDIAVFTFRVEAEADTVDGAQAEVSEKTQRIMELLDTSDIDEKDIKTLQYSANPQYDWLPPADCTREFCGNVQTLRNYMVSQTTEVKVRDLDNAGSIVGKIGGENVQYISGLTFTFDDETIFEEQALEIAIENAREKAKKRADIMDARLGKVIDFYENGGGYPEPYFEEAYSLDAKVMSVVSAPEPQFEAGESTVRKTIEVIFEVK